MNPISRRRFITASTLTAASAGFWPALGRSQTQPSVQSHPRGVNEDIRLAVVGFNGRGADHIAGFRKVKGVRLVALCDVDRDVLEKGIQQCNANGSQVEGYTDLRKLIENENIDVVSFATPNHWHALGSIWAIQAGKDVYVEKPVSHNVWEGRQIVAAARKYNRIVQTGTQARSSGGIREAIAWLREGHIGKIIRARGLCYKRRPSIGKAEGPQPIPRAIDYHLWCGPALMEPLRRRRLHYDWHWVWPTGNGDLGNQGVHQMDMARWILGENALSPRVLSIGGRLGYEDDGTTPNTLIVLHDYPAAPLLFEVRGLPANAKADTMDSYRGVSISVVVDCEGGYMVIQKYSGAKFFDKDSKEIKAFEGESSHFENFIAAVRSRKAPDLNADILEGHLSSALCHTANISYRLGKPHTPQEIRGAVRHNQDLAEAVCRMEEHLAANQVDLRNRPARLGAVLKMDPKREQFVGNHEADQLLTREYRKPFVVPAI